MEDHISCLQSLVEPDADKFAVWGGGGVGMVNYNGSEGPERARRGEERKHEVGLVYPVVTGLEGDVTLGKGRGYGKKCGEGDDGFLEMHHED